MSQVQAAEVFDVSLRSISRWLKAEREYGKRGLRNGRAGRRPGEQKALSKRTQRMICRIMLIQTPEQAGGEGLLWTRAAVADLIERRWEISLSLPTIGKYLKSWGLSPQRPIRRAYEQNPRAIQRWLKETYPAIVAAAQKDAGLIYFLDESGIGSADKPGTTWAPVGVTPVIPKTGQRFRVNLMAAITNQGHLRFTVYEGSLTVKRYIDFLDRLVRDSGGRRVHLIADQHPTHKAKTVKTWLAEHTEHLVQHFLPGYAPELNPVELLNGHTKKAVSAQAATRNRAQLSSKISTHLHRLQKQPATVKGFFRKPEVLYATVRPRPS